ncbi:hypothetical protein Salat_1886300 [Sesamum alatum]|uniref:Uncharacterized protein n=1 Tax=Sesamum alatum TaxID=300844 RepID=A0AAE1Y3W4_9LAMI|nr:hypothetical protein Salat_1886300 [Sesamum alatum]
MRFDLGSRMKLSFIDGRGRGFAGAVSDAATQLQDHNFADMLRTEIKKLMREEGASAESSRTPLDVINFADIEEFSVHDCPTNICAPNTHWLDYPVTISPPSPNPPEAYPPDHMPSSPSSSNSSLVSSPTSSSSPLPFFQTEAISEEEDDAQLAFPVIADSPYHSQCHLDPG